ncbi:MAG: SPOR domain-containing protein [Armatimonadetes bacterium]|nr:SPOR domain-containing protein [Armatimonadota bacterium]
MKRTTVMLALLVCLIATNNASAQEAYQEQSLAILKLYESGDKGKRDSAYKLIDRLKSDRQARFVPVVLFVRGEMTPDDRSLNLYREVIALEPGGAWSDDAAAALVQRYAANRDSLGAHTWLAMLKSNYPRSPLASAMQDSIAGIKDWKLPDAPAVAPKTGASTKNDTVRSQVRKPAQSAGQSAVRRDTAKTTKPATTAKTSTTSTTKKTSTATSSAKKSTSTSSSTKPTTPKASSTTKPTATKPSSSKTTAKPTSSTKPPTGASKTSASKPASDTVLSKLRGYALQVGVFPSKEAAQPQLTELQQKKLQVYALPKFIDGKKQYAVIVGPYPTLDDASNRKAEIAEACGCQAFIVKVE